MSPDVRRLAGGECQFHLTVLRNLCFNARSVRAAAPCEDETMTSAPLDVISIGRSSVDLYGQQVGGRLEDMATFSKAVGGCPTNIAIGTARLGLRSGVITRVGDEHMGRFIREQLVREGVDVRGRAYRSAAADLAGAAGRARRARLSADLLSRQLRRLRLGRKRHRRGIRLPRTRGARYRHAFRATGFGGGAAPGHRHRPARWRARRVRHRLSAEPVGPGRPRRGREPLCAFGPGDRSCWRRSCRFAT